VAPEQPAQPPKRAGSKRTVFIIMGVVLSAWCGGGSRWIYSLSHVSTDNAQVDGHIIQSSRRWRLRGRRADRENRR